MIEVVEEVKKELEPPTETDIRLLFGDLKKPMEALQAVFVAELEKLKKDGVETGNAKIEIEDGSLTVRVGNYCLWYEVRETVWKLGD